MLLEHGTPLVRPDDVLTGLARVSPAFAPAEIPVLTRLEQGRLDRAAADAGRGILTGRRRVTRTLRNGPWLWDTGCGSGAQ